MTEKTKNYLGWALVLGVLLVGVSAIWYAKTYAELTNVNYARSFGVTGEGRAVAVPDVAKFTFSVVTEGGKAIETLQADNIKKVNDAIAYLKEGGVDEKDISTEAYNVEPRYQNVSCVSRLTNGFAQQVCPPAEIVGYTIRQTVAVKVREMEKVGELLGGVVSRGANSTSGLQFTVDEPAKVEAEARGKAIAQAREKALAVAKAGGFRIGKLIMIEENNYPMPYYAKDGLGGAEMSVSSRPAMAPAPTFEPGSQDVTVNVSVRYEIK